MPPRSATVSASCNLYSRVLTNFTVTQCRLNSGADKASHSADTISCHCRGLVSVKGILWGECLG